MATKTRRHYIENILHERAKVSFKGDVNLINGNNIHVWIQHWIDVAVQLKAEFLAEGLVTTAGYVEEQIQYSQNSLRRVN